MNRQNILRFSLFIFLFLGILYNPNAFAQKIDVDSLLTDALHDLNVNKNYESTLKKSKLGIKLAPDYLDFYLLSGRAYDLTQKKDSARYYYNYVIDRNPKYEEAFSYLINLDLEEKKYDEAEITVNKAIEAHPQNKDFCYKKLTIYESQNDYKKEAAYLKELQQKYPDDKAIKLHYFILKTRNNSDRVGFNYSYTTFNRDGYGPWHSGSLNYIRERRWGSLIGRVSYTNRFASGESVANGIQYEAESYFFTGKSSYSYLGAAYSPDAIYPKLKLSYSFFHNFRKGWEADLGVRYLKAEESEFTTAVLGVGKYLGSYWLNLRTYLQSDKEDFYPAFTLTTRYYFNTRFDYISLVAGYGTSPDERTTIGQFEQRVALDSYRIGSGYYRLFNKHYVTGFQISLNNQEYAPGLKQNELELALMLQYKF